MGKQLVKQRNPVSYIPPYGTQRFKNNAKTKVDNKPTSNPIFCRYRMVCINHYPLHSRSIHDRCTAIFHFISVPSAVYWHSASSIISGRFTGDDETRSGSFQVDLRHVEEDPSDSKVKIGVDLSDFYLSVEWDILDVPAIR